MQLDNQKTPGKFTSAMNRLSKKNKEEILPGKGAKSLFKFSLLKMAGAAAALLLAFLFMSLMVPDAQPEAASRPSPSLSEKQYGGQAFTGRFQKTGQQNRPLGRLSSKESLKQGEMASLQHKHMLRAGRSWSGRERNCIFLNTGGDRRFADISATSGLGFKDDGRGLAMTDWDADGDLDVWISNRNAPQLRFLRNQSAGGGWLQLRLVGDGTGTNRDAIGARVEVRAAGLTGSGTKTLHGGDGFISQSSKWLHFGLGTADRVESVVVHWPGGEREEFGAPGIDARYRLVQGSGSAKPVTFRRTQPKAGRNDPCPCGSGKKYKRCCMLKDQAGQQAM